MEATIDEQILDLRRAGSTKRETIRQLGVTYSKVAKVWKQNEDPDLGKATAATSAIVAHYMRGGTDLDTARAMGKHLQIVRAALLIHEPLEFARRALASGLTSYTCLYKLRIPKSFVEAALLEVSAPTTRVELKSIGRRQITMVAESDHDSLGAARLMMRGLLGEGGSWSEGAVQ